MSLLDGFFSLAKKLNKTDSTENQQEGVVSDILPELALDMKDDELISLADKWETNWKDVASELDKKSEENKNYWKGIHFDKIEYLDNRRPMADNLIFESLETFLPVATRQNPEPMCIANGQTGETMAKNVQKMLYYLADILKLRLKIKSATRHWAINYLGCVKVGWSLVENEIDCKVTRRQDLILDPDAVIEEGEYKGEYIGHKMKTSASKLARRFEKKAEEIKKEVNGKMGTKLRYTEWWTDEYVFWKLNNMILGKAKNMHWNYNETKKTVDAYGKEQEQKEVGKNHFSSPRKPFVFLSIFNVGETCYDETSIIEQNLSNQDLINKRVKQIDKNADSVNGGSVVSGAHFEEEQAAKVDKALRGGGTVFVPSGDVREAYMRTSGNPLPNFVYQSLQDYRNELRSIFGTAGLTPASLRQERTVRGKILSSGQDGERIGGGVTEYLEQFADNIYNWFVQLMYVYYDEEHTGALLGQTSANEYFAIKNSEFNTKITVSVKEGSMLPKDAMSKRNEALELFKGKAIDPVSLFNKLDDPNPIETAKKVIAYNMSPEIYLQMISGGPLPVPPSMPPTDNGSPQINMPGQGEAPKPSNSLLSAVPLPK